MYNDAERAGVFRAAGLKALAASGQYGDAVQAELSALWGTGTDADPPQSITSYPLPGCPEGAFVFLRNFLPNAAIFPGACVSSRERAETENPQKKGTLKPDGPKHSKLFHPNTS